MHDRLAAYWTLSDETAHAVCNAYLLRNLQEEIVELEQTPDGWAARMQWRLLAARDIAAHGYETTAGLRAAPRP